MKAPRRDEGNRRIALGNPVDVVIEPSGRERRVFRRWMEVHILQAYMLAAYRDGELRSRVRAAWKAARDALANDGVLAQHQAQRTRVRESLGELVIREAQQRT